MFVCCECRVLSGRGLYDELITCPEESYLLVCVVVCDLETSWMRRPWPTGGCHAKRKKERKKERRRICFWCSNACNVSPGVLYDNSRYADSALHHKTRNVHCSNFTALCKCKYMPV